MGDMTAATATPDMVREIRTPAEVRRAKILAVNARRFFVLGA